MRALVIGGGIGGFATALSLHEAGIECDVFEQSPVIRELGVGMNLLPHATGVLTGLGLLDALDRVAVRTQELIYMNRFGQEVWREPRGVDAGHDYPQFSVHRGRLLGVLRTAARKRGGTIRVHTGHRLVGFQQDDAGVTATLARRDASGTTVTVRGDLLVAADGIHSTVRRAFQPAEGPPRWNGVMMWRGAVEFPRFLTGRSMIIAGGMGAAKLVLYPISRQSRGSATNLLNWAVCLNLGDGSQPPPEREDWSTQGRLEDLLPRVRQAFRPSVVDPVKIIEQATQCHVYPMCDRDPLQRWSYGRVTLLGDAAHPMYPVGSNGASQAILDARCLATQLAETPDIPTALHTYETQRLPATARIVHDNRRGGPERVIDVVEERAPNGFTTLDDITSHTELQQIINAYSAVAGLRPST